MFQPISIAAFRISGSAFALATQFFGRYARPSTKKGKSSESFIFTAMSDSRPRLGCFCLLHK